MNLFQVILLSITRGLLEFLPISSTGHVIILQKLLGFPETNEFLTVVLKFAAILASIFYFREKIFSIIKDTISNVKKGNYLHDKGIIILIATVPSLIIAFIATKFLDFLQNSTLIIAINSIIFGVLFYSVERMFLNKGKKLSPEKVTLKNLLVMGTAQGLAVAPGVSRSGSSTATGLTQHLDIRDSIELSFLMGIPLLTAASSYEVLKYHSAFSSGMVFMTIVGFIITFLFALLSIKLTLGWLTKHGFFPFMVYRVLFGVVLIVLLLSGVLRS